MTGKPESFDVSSVTGATLLADGSISVEMRDDKNRELVLSFKPEHHVHFLHCLLPRRTSMSSHRPRAFSADRLEILQSPRGNLGMQFDLSGEFSMTVEVPIELAAWLRDRLNELRFEEDSLQ